MTAINQQIRRLPGFRFETRTALRDDVLPRMDVALFVGFAAKGAINIPVALESAAQFEQIFGSDLPLVWDKEKGATIYAYLAPTVRMFFRNGGRRCWVIRTARTAAETNAPLNFAAYNFFPLTGLAEIRFDENDPSEIVPAFARSSSKGSWSDNLQVSTAMISTSVKFKKLSESDGEKIVHIETAANQPINPGDLLRLDFPDSDLVLILKAKKIENDSESNLSNGKLNLKISSGSFIWLQDLPTENFPASQNVQVKMWTQQTDSSIKDFAGTVTETRQAVLEFKEIEKHPATNKSRTRIRLKFLNLIISDAPIEGDLLVTKFENELLCMQVETVKSAKIGNQEIVQLICKGVFILKTAVQPNDSPDVERLVFDIWIKDGEKVLTKLNDLAFNSGHEKFWGNLSTDDDFYGFQNNQISLQLPSRMRNEEFANSPIAGNGDGERDGFFIPVFPTTLTEKYLGAVKLKGTKLQRDGLQIFDERLFLDDKLKNSGLNNVLNDAEFIRYLSPNPRRLWGIHSALAAETVTAPANSGLPDNPVYTSFSLDEATIISVPDALHRGWFQTDEKGSATVMPKPFHPPKRPEWWRFQDCRNKKIEAVEKPLWGNFLDFDLKIIEPPKNLRVDETEISDGTFTLVCDYDNEDENLIFVLEESATPEFEFPQIIFGNKRKSFEISNHGAGIFYYRVRAEIGDAVSNWSNGLKVKIPAAGSWTAKFLEKNESPDSEKNYSTDVLLAVQRALLRICAARGDMFAVLDLPAHFDKDEAVNYVATLKATKGLTNATAQVEPFSADEKTALSYGAVYHPWLFLREENFEEVRIVPPSGAMCGVFAKRSIERGAWIAPANEVLQNVLGTAKDFRRETFLDFQDALINLVRREPNGFLVLDSDTLSDDFDLRQINVRRLLSLLRRLALKHGAEYVFEPNDERFRRNVQRGFKSLLDKMFVRGAFAGNTPEKSYQVVVSDTINNFQSVEQGRFIVELRVAPSLPLKFVTVRLINSGGRSSVSETV